MRNIIKIAGAAYVTAVLVAGVSHTILTRGRTIEQDLVSERRYISVARNPGKVLNLVEQAWVDIKQISQVENTSVLVRFLNLGKKLVTDVEQISQPEKPSISFTLPTVNSAPLVDAPEKQKQRVSKYVWNNFPGVVVGVSASGNQFLDNRNNQSFLSKPENQKEAVFVSSIDAK